MAEALQGHVGEIPLSADQQIQKTLTTVDQALHPGEILLGSGNGRMVENGKTATIEQIRKATPVILQDKEENFESNLVDVLKEEAPAIARATIPPDIFKKIVPNGNGETTPEQRIALLNELIKAAKDPSLRILGGSFDNALRQLGIQRTEPTVKGQSIDTTGPNYTIAAIQAAIVEQAQETIAEAVKQQDTKTEDARRKFTTADSHRGEVYGVMRPDIDSGALELGGKYGATIDRTVSLKIGNETRDIPTSQILLILRESLDDKSPDAAAAIEYGKKLTAIIGQNFADVPAVQTFAQTYDKYVKGQASPAEIAKLQKQVGSNSFRLKEDGTFLAEAFKQHKESFSDKAEIGTAVREDLMAAQQIINSMVPAEFHKEIILLENQRKQAQEAGNSELDQQLSQQINEKRQTMYKAVMYAYDVQPENIDGYAATDGKIDFTESEKSLGELVKMRRNLTVTYTDSNGKEQVSTRSTMNAVDANRHATKELLEAFGVNTSKLNWGELEASKQAIVVGAERAYKDALKNYKEQTHDGVNGAPPPRLETFIRNHLRDEILVELNLLGTDPNTELISEVINYRLNTEIRLAGFEHKLQEGMVKRLKNIFTGQKSPTETQVDIESRFQKLTGDLPEHLALTQFRDMGLKGVEFLHRRSLSRQTEKPQPTNIPDIPEIQQLLGTQIILMEEQQDRSMEELLGKLDSLSTIVAPENTNGTGKKEDDEQSNGQNFVHIPSENSNTTQGPELNEKDRQKLEQTRSRRAKRNGANEGKDTQFIDPFASDEKDSKPIEGAPYELEKNPDPKRVAPFVLEDKNEGDDSKPDNNGTDLVGPGEPDGFNPKNSPQRGGSGEVTPAANTGNDVIETTGRRIPNELNGGNLQLTDSQSSFQPPAIKQESQLTQKGIPRVWVINPNAQSQEKPQINQTIEDGVWQETQPAEIQVSGALKVTERFQDDPNFRLQVLEGKEQVEEYPELANAPLTLIDTSVVRERERNQGQLEMNPLPPSRQITMRPDSINTETTQTIQNTNGEETPTEVPTIVALPTVNEIGSENGHESSRKNADLPPANETAVHIQPPVNPGTDHNGTNGATHKQQSQSTNNGDNGLNSSRPNNEPPTGGMNETFVTDRDKTGQIVTVPVRNVGPTTPALSDSDLRGQNSRGTNRYPSVNNGDRDIPGSFQPTPIKINPDLNRSDTPVIPNGGVASPPSNRRPNPPSLEEAASDIGIPKTNIIPNYEDEFGQDEPTPEYTGPVMYRAGNEFKDWYFPKSGKGILYHDMYEPRIQPVKSNNPEDKGKFNIRFKYPKQKRPTTVTINLNEITLDENGKLVIPGTNSKALAHIIRDVQGIPGFELPKDVQEALSKQYPPSGNENPGTGGSPIPNLNERYRDLQKEPQEASTQSNTRSGSSTVQSINPIPPSTSNGPQASIPVATAEAIAPVQVGQVVTEGKPEKEVSEATANIDYSPTDTPRTNFNEYGEIVSPEPTQYLPPLIELNQHRARVRELVDNDTLTPHEEVTANSELQQYPTLKAQAFQGWLNENQFQIKEDFFTLLQYIQRHRNGIDQVAPLNEAGAEFKKIFNINPLSETTDENELYTVFRKIFEEGKFNDQNAVNALDLLHACSQHISTNPDANRFPPNRNIILLYERYKEALEEIMDCRIIDYKASTSIRRPITRAGVKYNNRFISEHDEYSVKDRQAAVSNF